MSDFAIASEDFHYEVVNDALALYQFDTKIAKHYFCKVCGIYPFHETMRIPGHYRVNLGCIDSIDTDTLPFTIFDGKSI